MSPDQFINQSEEIIESNVTPVFLKEGRGVEEDGESIESDKDLQEQIVAMRRKMMAKS
tara:strand:+ start:721 stop:894 length:174 start_codon:yes stop_codon:yes gene_type:complete